ncbi:MAG: anti-sigma factor family protein [Bacillota bacterium]
MRDCQIVQEKLSLFMDDQLSLSEKRNIEAHLATCQLCSREYERLRRTVDLLRSLEPVEVPSDFRFKLHVSVCLLRDPKTTPPWKKLVSRPWLSLGAAAAGFLLLVHDHECAVS